MHKIKNCSIPVPCGRCPDCLKRRVDGWVFRLTQEYKRCQYAHFVTLTYDTKYVPLTKNGFMSLDFDHITKFFKRLRKSLEVLEPQPVVKYYLAGEYGSDTNRPHYHAIIFNVPDWSYIEKAWGLGFVHYGQDVTEAAMSYTCKYIDKPKRIPMHKNDDRVREASRMSKGIGDNYVNWENVCYHTADLHNRVHLTTGQGYKIAMPRYYKERIYHEFQKMAISVQMQREADKRLDKAQQHFKGEYFTAKFKSDQAAIKKHGKNAKKRNAI